VPRLVGAFAAVPAPRGAARRELILLVSVVVVVTRLASGPLLWLAGMLALFAAAFGAIEALGAEADSTEPGVPVESLILPGVAAVAAVGALQLVPVGIVLVPAWVGTLFLLWATLEVERRILVHPDGPTADDRAALLSLLLLIGFLGFAGIAAAIPGAFVDPGAAVPVTSATELSLGSVILLAAGDGLVAGLLGYRLAALRAPTLAQVLAAALTYAALIAIAAAGLRALAIPRLVGPALLVLILYLRSAYRGGPRGNRRDPRWLIEVAALVLLGIIVVTVNLLTRT
jgi:hypothetical protein